MTAKELARLVHDVGKYVARTARNLPAAPTPEMLDMLVRDLYELRPGRRASALLAELALIRDRGYAQALGEVEVGLNAVAAPVRDGSGQVIAAVSISGPAYRVTPQRLNDLGEVTKEAGEAISRRLGYIPGGGEA